MMFRTKALHFSYNPTQTFHFPDIACEQGRQLLILGQSGKGKTTLLHLFAGFLTPQSGEIWFDETAFHQLSKTQADIFRGKNIGMIFQKHYLMQALNVLENVLLSQYANKIRLQPEKATDLLKKLGLLPKLKSLPSQLSQGEQQRVCIARALLNQPKIIFADEPTSSLDDENCEKVVHLLQNQTQEFGASLIIVTHDNRLSKHFSEKLVL